VQQELKPRDKEREDARSIISDASAACREETLDSRQLALCKGPCEVRLPRTMARRESLVLYDDPALQQPRLRFTARTPARFREASRIRATTVFIPTLSSRKVRLSAHSLPIDARVFLARDRPSRALSASAV